ncbi:MAG: NUDIX domain-containing protein [Candidatus Dadabacteria bacterium]
MPSKKSAGLLLYRGTGEDLQFFLVHPGGPFWKNKDVGAWSIPKGEFPDDEDPLLAARREFLEETGQEIDGNFFQLQPVIQKAGKQVLAWAVEGDIDPGQVVSNTFKIEWPYKSGKWREFPEVDKAGWFSVDKAKELINPAQIPFIDELLNSVDNQD